MHSDQFSIDRGVGHAIATRDENAREQAISALPGASSPSRVTSVQATALTTMGESLQ